MAIRYLQDLARAGAAVCIHLDCAEMPPAARQMRILRRWDAAFPAQPEADAYTHVVYAGPLQTGVLDWHGLVPDIEHWYADYYWVEGTWRRGTPRAVRPTVQAHPPVLDSLDVLRERLEVGLAAYLQAGILRHPRGTMSVMMAPPALDDVALPAVAVHLEQAVAEHRYIGGHVYSALLGGPKPEGSGDAACRREVGGWISRYSVLVEAWSLNPDERRLLRLALRDILVGSQDVFALCGLQEMEVTWSDDEDFQSYNAPLYCARARVSYLAPDVVWAQALPIRDITFLADGGPP